MTSEDRWRLEDRREFLRRSLDDADREHDTGDLADQDYLLLRRRDEEQLAEVERELAAIGAAAGAGTNGGGAGAAGGPSEPSTGAGVVEADRPTAPKAEGGATRSGGAAGRLGTRGLVPLVLDDDEDGDQPRRRKRRWWMAVVGVAAIVAGVVVLVVNVSSPRLPGETITGNTHLSHSQAIDQQLAYAATLVQQNKLVTALDVYKKVLSETPKQPQALAEWGWLDWQAANTAGNLSLAAEGRSAVAESVKVDPTLYAGHLYLGTILLDQKQPAAAAAEYKKFLASHPPQKWVVNAAPFITKAFTDAHQPVPAQVKAAAGK